MRTSNVKMKNDILALAVQGALIAMFTLPMIAQAEEAAVDEAAALTHPTNSVELGGTSISRNSAKFGEYNGLDENGAYGIANINLRGGNGYEQGDNNIRWQLKGVDLGTTSREVGAEISSQGQWNVGVKFDELRHNITDSYQTPYDGKMGGNSFTLPASFGTAANTTALSTPQKAALHNVDIYTTRENTSITAGYIISPQWGVTLDFNHLNQTGAKLMAFAAAGGVVKSAVTGEVVSILPNPTNYTTDTVNFAVNWTGDKGHISSSYSGSYFRNAYDSVTFTTYAGANATQTMSSAPDNNFHQLNLLGGYALSDNTKLAGGLSYGRGTQDNPYAVDAAGAGLGAGVSMMVTPLSFNAFDGKVITTHGDLKITNQSINKLALSAGVKYDERDNKSPSNLYNFLAVDGAHPANYPNTPYSNRKTQYELAGDYRLTNSQHIRLAYNRENVQRWCNDYAVSSNYPAGTNCVVATDSKDDKISAAYKLNVTEDLKLNAGYSYSDRKTTSDTSARSAFLSVKGGVGGTGTILGLNGGDYLGYYPFFAATRRQQTLKAGANWNALEKLSFGLGGQYSYDDYYDSTYGVQRGNSWSINFDTTLNYSETGAVTAYVTRELRSREEREVTSVTSTPPQSWTTKLHDGDISFGLNARQDGLMAGKLKLTGDLTYSLAKTGYKTYFVDYVVSNCGTASVLSCGILPDIYSRLAQIKLGSEYKVNKTGTVGLDYIYQRLTSNDFFYNSYQYGNTPAKVMPTNQDSGSYSINAVVATYTYNF